MCWCLCLCVCVCTYAYIYIYVYAFILTDKLSFQFCTNCFVYVMFISCLVQLKLVY